MRLSRAGGGGVSTSLSEGPLAGVVARSPEPRPQMTSKDHFFPAHGFAFRLVGQGDVGF